jgi:tetracycline resistance efflux pump
MVASWLSLLPPLLVITLASYTKRLNTSLIIGLFIAGLLATSGNPLEASLLLIKRIVSLLYDLDTFCNYFFLVIISALIVLISRTGGALAFAHTITKKLKSARMAQVASLLVSSTLFIDDYLNNLTVGYAMRSLTDRFAIPRVKLAYLVHALSSPLVIISPISSWVSVLTGRLEKAHIAPTIEEHTKIIAEPFVLYVQSIPWMFYSFLLIGSAWFVVLMKISFGPMQRQELIAQKDGNLFGGKSAPADTIEIQEKKHASAFDLILPVVLLVGTVFIGFLYAGGYHLFGGPYSMVQALQHNTQTALVLLIAGIVTLLISGAVALVRKTLSWHEVPSIASDGVLFMYSTIIMIFLASTLGDILTRDLLAGEYIATLVQGTLPSWFLPALLFITASATAFTIGSSWGTMALIMPIGTQVLTTLMGNHTPYYPQDIPLLLPVIGAIFTGAICGNHISPISDTTIMASASSGAYTLDHIYTQLPYVIPVIISTVLAYICAGLLAPLYPLWTVNMITLGIGIISCFGMLLLCNRIFKTAQ